MTRIEPMVASDEAEGLYSLVYTSSAAAPFSTEDLDDLLHYSRASNRAHDITGLLLYRRGRFTQFVEGPEGAVRALLARIQADSRHTSIRVLIDGFAATRQLPEWTMGYETVAHSDTPPPEGFRDTFEDLESIGDDDAVIRALRELTLWFRVRSSTTP